VTNGGDAMPSSDAVLIAGRTKQLDNIVAIALRIGLTISTLLMLVGGGVYFSISAVKPDYEHFEPGPHELRTIPGIIDLAMRGDPTGFMQLAVVLLIATPFMRVAFAGITFFVQRDWKFVMISFIVFSALVYGLYAGHTG
jgi:uncharacterized membrane protein